MLARIMTLILVSALLAIGCRSSKPPVIPAGFFPERARLTDLDGDGTAIGYRNRSLALGQFTGCFIAPVQVDPQAADGDDVSSDQLAQLGNDFGAALAKSISQKIAIVSAPGAGIITVNATIMRAVPNKPALNLAPQTQILQRGYGYASVVVRADSLDGASIMGFADTRSTQRFGADKLSTWGSVEASFTAWADEIAGLLSSAPE